MYSVMSNPQLYLFTYFEKEPLMLIIITGFTKISYIYFRYINILSDFDCVDDITSCYPDL